MLTLYQWSSDRRTKRPRAKPATSQLRIQEIPRDQLNQSLITDLLVYIENPFGPFA